MQHDAYDEEEFWSRDQIEATQLARLKNVVARVYKGCEFYRKRLDEAGVTPDSIKTLDDIEKIPMTSKDDLRSQYPYGLATVPHSSDWSSFPATSWCACTARAAPRARPWLSPIPRMI